MFSSAGLSELKVGAGPVFHLNWVAGLFADLLQQFPELKLDLKTEHRESMGKLLSSGALDVYLGILSDEEKDSSIVTTHVTQIEHGIVLREDDPISTTETINPGRPRRLQMGKLHNRSGHRAKDRAIHATERLKKIADRYSHDISGHRRSTCKNRAVRHVCTSSTRKCCEKGGSGNTASPESYAATQRRNPREKKLFRVRRHQNRALVF